MISDKKLFQGWSKEAEGHYGIVSLNTEPFDVGYANVTIANLKDFICFILIVEMTIPS